MARQIITLGVLKIASGTQQGAALSTLGVNAPPRKGWAAIGMATAICIHAPATLPEVVTVVVQPESDSVWRTLVTQGGVPYTIAAGQSLLIPAVVFADLSLQSNTNVAADRNFTIDVQEDVT